MKANSNNIILSTFLVVFLGTAFNQTLHSQRLLGKVKKEIGKNKPKKEGNTSIESVYEGENQTIGKEVEAPNSQATPFAMKEYNTSSPIYDKIEFFDFSTSGYKSRNIEFFVTLARSEDGFKWTKKVMYKNGQDTSEPYQAKTSFTYGPNGEKIGDEKDKQVFYITPPKEGKPYGALFMKYDFFNEGGNTGGIILFGEQSHEELKLEVQQMKILSTNEEESRSSLEKNHVGEIVFSSEELKKTLPESSLKTEFTLGEPIYFRVVLKDPTNSMRELFIKEGLSPDYQNSWPLLEYYRNGELIGVYENVGRGFTGLKQASANRDGQELHDRFDRNRSFGEALLETDFYIYNTAAPLWNGLLTASGLKNGKHKIDMKYYVVHIPSEGHDTTKENKGRIYKKLVSEGSFDLLVTDSGKEMFCVKAKLCKK
ncbi:hypothetical protein [Flagellimonas allohymeniacidonis]|uniref:Uncharacterized protein n=1 Tax=Flagellimonas allohymeniacidonis TaxID=2517819 RepID=A0A4Q8QCY0_9FLAO|nr:hypothetical protein [Allomuricauda hymeniacidonis]TAI48235.1 hypothetical protein EW142_00010 [Allomuricauda hymeniacidonis]